MQLMNISGEKLREAIEIANETADDIMASGRNHTEEVRDLFQEADVVIGVWPDPAASGGAQAAILKGVGRLRLIAQGRTPQMLKQAYLRVREGSEAQALCELFGDERAVALRKKRR